MNKPETLSAVGSMQRVGHVKKCPIGTLVSYRSVDGTCRTVENYRHAWCKDGTCANCDMTREQAGYTPTYWERYERNKKVPNATELSHSEKNR